MILLPSRDGDFYLGDHNVYTVEEFRKEITDFGLEFFHPIKDFFGIDLKKYEDYITLYGKNNSLERCALLLSNGETNGEWSYFDIGKKHSVQSWIDEVDGKYSAIVLDVNNRGCHTPNSEKSILVVPDHDHGHGEYPQSRIFNLLVPGVGEIDSNTIDYELGQLWKRILPSTLVSNLER